MREILFRAKRIDNGEWIEGDLVHAPDGRTAVSTYDDLVETVPETVCQYTGLTDKNGRKIFEGDILNVTYSDQQGECHYVENYVLDDLRKTSVMGWLDYANELEVVGNIFDNTELVE